MKILKYSYMFLWIFVIPVIIGLSVADLLLRIYHNFNEHLLAGLAVCILSGLVVTWIPMVFLIEDVNFREKRELLGLTLLLWVVGLVSPIVFGFRSLGKVIAILLIFSAAFTVTKLATAISQISKRLQNFRKDDRS